MNGLLIGRFQPFHLGHLEALKFALKKVDRLWVGIGSSNQSISSNNPFSAAERQDMIINSLDSSMLNRIKIYFIPDVNNHAQWIENISKIVPDFSIVFSNDELTAHLYSKKNVKVIPIPFKQREVLSGTNIRNLIKMGQKWHHLVPDGTRKILDSIDAKTRLSRL